MIFNNTNRELRFGVAIVTYNRLSLLKECLKCILNQKYKFDKVLLINNCSTDGTKKYLDEIANQDDYKNFEIFTTKKNLGGSGGFKLAVEKLYESVDYLLLIDDDAMLDRNFLYNIICKLDDSIGAYSGTVETDGRIDTTHRRVIKNKIFMTKADVEKDKYQKEYFDYDLSTFCGLIVNTKIIKKIGFPKSEYFIWYDDTEYSLRIGKYTKIRNINSALINHKAVSSVTNKLSWKSYYGYRNAIDVGKKYSKMPLIYLGYRYSFHVFKFFMYLSKSLITKCVKKKKYYSVCAHLNLDVIHDSLCNQLGKSDIYYPGYKF